MNPETSFAYLTTDSGLVAEILHVSPMFVRFGPPARGRFAERREARTRRTDARHARRIQPRADGDSNFFRSFTANS